MSVQISARALLDYLIGEGARTLVEAAVRGAPRACQDVTGGRAVRLGDCQVDAWQVDSTHVRPGGAVSVVFRVHLSAAEQRLIVFAVASTERLARGSATALRLDLRPYADEDGPAPIPVYVWVYPHDPILSGLAWAHDLEAVRSWLESRGAELTVPQVNHMEVTTDGGANLVQGRDELAVDSVTRVVYRPTRRAMVRVSAGGQPVAWIKVMKPRRVAALARTIEVLSRSGVPVPPLLGQPAPDVLVQAHGRGFGLAQLISREPHVAARLFPELSGVLDSFSSLVMSFKRRPSWTDRRVQYARAMVALIPSLQRPVERLMGTVEPLVRDDQPLVPTHGDFFEANIMTDGRQVSALLDLDSIGPGLRADDYACLLAHVSVLPFLTPQRWVVAPRTEVWRSRLDQFLPGRRCPAYPDSETVLEAWRLRAEREVHAADLYARCAFVTLSLAASASLTHGEDEARARFARACWWGDLAVASS